MSFSDQLLMAGAHVDETLDDQHPHKQCDQTDDPEYRATELNKVPDGFEKWQIIKNNIHTDSRLSDLPLSPFGQHARGFFLQYLGQALGAALNQRMHEYHRDGDNETEYGGDKGR